MRCLLRHFDRRLGPGASRRTLRGRFASAFPGNGLALPLPVASRTHVLSGCSAGCLCSAASPARWYTFSFIRAAPSRLGAQRTPSPLRSALRQVPCPLPSFLSHIPQLLARSDSLTPPPCLSCTRTSVDQPHRGAEPRLGRAHSFIPNRYAPARLLRDFHPRGHDSTYVDERSLHPTAASLCTVSRRPPLVFLITQTVKHRDRPPQTDIPSSANIHGIANTYAQLPPCDLHSRSQRHSTRSRYRRVPANQRTGPSVNLNSSHAFSPVLAYREALVLACFELADTSRVHGRDREKMSLKTSHPQVP